MSHNTYDFTAGDTGSKIRVRMIDGLTGALLVPFNGTYNAYVVVKNALGVVNTRTMTLLTGANDGYAEYQFTPSELSVGTLQTQVYVQKVSDGSIVTELGIKEYSVGPKLS